jgi:hypothetical protein
MTERDVDSEQQPHLPRFGINDKRVHRQDAAGLIVDAIDVGLYGQIDPESTSNGGMPIYADNASVWNDILMRRISHGDSIKLERFHVLEWLPASPGRYFTQEAGKQRESAQRYWDRMGNEFLPLGKAEMILAGIGSVRLAPRTVRGGDVCFFSASANGISHEGVPIVIPIDLCRPLLRQIRQDGSCIASVTGTLWPLPVDKSPISFDRGVPKYVLFSEEIKVEAIGPHQEPLVTVAITYSSTYEGIEVPLGEISVSPEKNWSFASFSPAKGADALKSAVLWLESYASRYGGGQRDGGPSILGDFDEVERHFKNPIEFPLSSVLAGRYDPRFLDLYGRYYSITINREVILGDKFENISNSTIINRSQVGEAIKALNRSAPDVAEALALIAEHVSKSKSAAANAVLNEFTGELAKAKPDKSMLRRCWEGLTAILPDVAKLAGATAKIATLFS